VDNRFKSRWCNLNQQISTLAGYLKIIQIEDMLRRILFGSLSITLDLQNNIF